MDPPDLMGGQARGTCLYVNGSSVLALIRLEAWAVLQLCCAEYGRSSPAGRTFLKRYTCSRPVVSRAPFYILAFARQGTFRHPIPADLGTAEVTALK